MSEAQATPLSGDRKIGNRKIGDRQIGDRPNGHRPTGNRPTGVDLADPPTGRRDERALMALILLLCVMAIWQMSRDDTPDLPDSVAVPLQRPSVRQSGGTVPEYAEMLERPLFHPSRRRTPEPEAVPPEPVLPATAVRGGLDGWTLIGLMDFGDRAIALVRQGANGPVQTLRTGEQLGDWTLIGAAGRGAALFERDEEQLELIMPARDDTNASQVNPR